MNERDWVDWVVIAANLLASLGLFGSILIYWRQKNDTENARFEQITYDAYRATYFLESELPRIMHGFKKNIRTLNSLYNTKPSKFSIINKDDFYFFCFESTDLKDKGLNGYHLLYIDFKLDKLSYLPYIYGLRKYSKVIDDLDKLKNYMFITKIHNSRLTFGYSLDDSGNEKFYQNCNKSIEWNNKSYLLAKDIIESLQKIE
ncbi:hypothetical protein [Proteus mirabilis]|uniref:hypothetical protein n=1 Tax=Proteus mirabilis TaxID=584 RepID=UPI0031B778A9